MMKMNAFNLLVRNRKCQLNLNVSDAVALSVNPGLSLNDNCYIQRYNKIFTCDRNLLLSMMGGGVRRCRKVNPGQYGREIRDKKKSQSDQKKAPDQLRPAHLVQGGRHVDTNRQKHGGLRGAAVLGKNSVAAPAQPPGESFPPPPQTLPPRTPRPSHYLCNNRICFPNSA